MAVAGSAAGPSSPADPYLAPKVQSGSRAWERRFFDSSLIADALPPLWMSEARARGETARGAVSAPPPAVASAAAPERHPTHGFRLLYALASPSSPAPRRALSPAQRLRAADGDAVDAAALQQPQQQASSDGGRRISGEGATAPFPGLAAWVCARAPRQAEGGSVSVSRWSAFVRDVKFHVGGGAAVQPVTVVESLTLVLAGSRWCGRVGRHHKSNGVFVTVNLLAGVAVQRCFDNECRGFAGTAVAVPAELVPSQAPDGGVLVRE